MCVLSAFLLATNIFRHNPPPSARAIIIPTKSQVYYIYQINNKYTVNSGVELRSTINGMKRLVDVPRQTPMKFLDLMLPTAPSGVLFQY